MNIRSIIYGLLVMAVVPVVQSCNTSYPELEYVNKEKKPVNEEEQGTTVIKPTLDYHNLFYTSSTRGYGAFDSEHYRDIFEDVYLSSKFYVMAFRKTVAQSGDLSSPASYTSMMNQKDLKDCLVSSTITSGGKANRGKLSIPAGLEGVLQFYDDTTGTMKRELYWSSKYKDAGYDFYAYHIDDAKINSITADADHINYDMTIDGTQDVMAGASRPLTLDYLTKTYPTLPTYVKDSILTNAQHAYSTYAAIYGVQPVIDVKHLLSRLKFYVVYKDDTKDFADSLPDITITGVKVKANSRINCCLVARDSNDIKLNSSSEEAWLTLRNVPTVVDGTVMEGTPIREKMMYIDRKDSLGESINVPQQTSYDMELTYDQHLMTKYDDPDNPGHYKYETVTRTAKTTIKRKDNQLFEPGVTYIVVLNIYGAQRIDVYVDGTLWSDGGSVDIDINDY